MSDETDKRLREYSKGRTPKPGGEVRDSSSRRSRARQNGSRSGSGSSRGDASGNQGSSGQGSQPFGSGNGESGSQQASESNGTTESNETSRSSDKSDTSSNQRSSSESSAGRDSSQDHGLPSAGERPGLTHPGESRECADPNDIWREDSYDSQEQLSSPESYDAEYLECAPEPNVEFEAPSCSPDGLPSSGERPELGPSQAGDIESVGEHSDAGSETGLESQDSSDASPDATLESPGSAEPGTEPTDPLDQDSQCDGPVCIQAPPDFATPNLELPLAVIGAAVAIGSGIAAAGEGLLSEAAEAIESASGPLTSDGSDTQDPAPTEPAQDSIADTQEPNIEDPNAEVLPAIQDSAPSEGSEQDRSSEQQVPERDDSLLDNIADGLATIDRTVADVQHEVYEGLYDVASALQPYTAPIEQAYTDARVAVVDELEETFSGLDVSGALEGPRAGNSELRSAADVLEEMQESAQPDFSHSAPYEDLRRSLADPLVDAHHLLEKRFQGVLDISTDPSTMPAVELPRDSRVVSPDYSGPIHRRDINSVTEMLRAQIPHGAEFSASQQEIWDAHARVYTAVGHPEWLDDIRSFFDESEVDFRIPND